MCSSRVAEPRPRRASSARKAISARTSRSSVTVDAGVGAVWAAAESNEEDSMASVSRSNADVATRMVARMILERRGLAAKNIGGIIEGGRGMAAGSVADYPLIGRSR